MNDIIRTAHDEERTEAPRARLEEAVAAAVERCPEYTDELHRVRELAWVASLYSQSYAEMKRRYRALSDENERVRRAHDEYRNRAAREV